MKPLIVFLLAFILFGILTARAHQVTSEMSTAAQIWLAALDEDQKKLATFKLGDRERENWDFIPRPFEGEGVRGGLSLKDMRSDQQHLAYGLLSTALSHRGFLTATQIMSLERVLWEFQNEDPRRDSRMYYFAIFGNPEAKNWGWRFEGHHISLNFTIANGKLVSSTPNFWATNPHEIPKGPRAGLRVLAAEEDVARSLVQSLSQKQLKSAQFSDTAPDEILTGTDPIAAHLGDAGIRFEALTPEQQSMLFDLINIYVHRLRSGPADEQLTEIKQAGHENIRFAWAGSVEKGQQHYYRVQGPTFLIEYANTRDEANHVHAVWRDFDGDFGRDFLREHYRAEHLSDEAGEWETLFDGESLEGWSSLTDQGAFKVVDGTIRAHAVGTQMDHLFFSGDSEEGFERFDNFELELLARGEKNANSGIFIHADRSTYKERLYLDSGYEIQLNCKEKEKRKTGSLYDIVDYYQSPIDELEWFRVNISVINQRITVALNGEQVVDYTEPDNPERSERRKNRLLMPKGGGIALQAHDPDSVFYFKEIRIKRLP